MESDFIFSWSEDFEKIFICKEEKSNNFSSSGGNVEAVEQVNIDWEGKTLFNVKYYGASDYTEARAAMFPNNALNYDLTSDIKSGLNEAFKWWAEILEPGANISQPAQYFVGTNDVGNAAAHSYSFRNGAATQNPKLFDKIFQSGQTMQALRLNCVLALIFRRLCFTKLGTAWE